MSYGEQNVQAVPTESGSSSNEAMSRLQSLIASTNSALERLQKIGDKIWGPQLRTAPESSPSPPKPPGLFGAIQYLDETIQKIHKEIDRF